jgi:hypothetical protein
MRHIVQHVAALAQAAKVAQPVVRRVAVEVRGGEHDAGETQARSLDQIRPAAGLALAIAPGARRLVEPATVRQAAEPEQVGAPAGLAASAGTLESDTPAQLAPVPRSAGQFWPTPPVPQPTVTLMDQGAFCGLESQSGFVRAAPS